MVLGNGGKNFGMGTRGGKAMSDDNKAPPPPAAAPDGGGIAGDLDWAALAENPRKLPALTEVSENSDSYKEYVNQVAFVDRTFKIIARRGRLEIRPLEAIARRLLTVARDRPGGYINYILGGEVSRHELAKNAVNTAILSAHIALEMKFPSHRIMQTITGALLHDVGMLRLPQELLKKTGALSAEELRLIQSHTLHSYRIVHEELSYPADMGTLVLQHHENWDGSGYPQGMAGEEIHFGARIV
jgi:HD-GYP domain-containing protein (c-di-GMP phosphodiesterase class II)